jgi:hypothetical protein
MGQKSKRERKIMETFKKLTSKLIHRVLFIILCLLGLSATADASDIWQVSYIYKYELVKDAGGSTFVICDDCTESKRLPLSFRQKILSSLTVRASDNITEKSCHCKSTHIENGKREEVRK